MKTIESTLMAAEITIDLISKFNPQWCPMTFRVKDVFGKEYLGFCNSDNNGENKFSLLFDKQSGDRVDLDYLNYEEIVSSENYKYYSDIISDMVSIGSKMYFKLLNKKSWLFRHYLNKDSGPFGQGMQDKNFNFVKPKTNLIKKFFKSFSNYDLYLNVLKMLKQQSFRLSQIEVLGEDPYYNF